MIKIQGSGIIILWPRLSAVSSLIAFIYWALLLHSYLREESIKSNQLFIHQKKMSMFLSLAWLCVKVLSLVCTPQPPYSYRLDECAELICFNGELLLHNASLHCRYNTSQPHCSLLGLPLLSNTDPCCPQWQCPCKCALSSISRVFLGDRDNVSPIHFGMSTQVCESCSLWCQKVL